MRFILLLSLVITLISFGNADGQVGKLYPADQADQDPSFMSFRMHLIESIAKGDTAFIYNHLSRNILTTFGGDGGIDEFKEYWKPHSENSELWVVLARVIGGGGIYSNGTFTAPYYYTNFPSENYNAFDYGAILDEHVLVRTEPNHESKVLAELSYDIVKVIDYNPDNNTEHSRSAGWVLIKLQNGEKGYIENKVIGSAVDYRARFEKRNGKWLIKALAAGD